MRPGRPGAAGGCLRFRRCRADRLSRSIRGSRFTDYREATSPYLFCCNRRPRNFRKRQGNADADLPASAQGDFAPGFASQQETSWSGLLAPDRDARSGNFEFGPFCSSAPLLLREPLAGSAALAADDLLHRLSARGIRKKEVSDIPIPLSVCPGQYLKKAILWIFGRC